MPNFVKLFESITDSTVWSESHATRIVWITMLAMAGARGAVSASVPGLAHRARVTLEECEHALARFLAPDKYSRTSDHDGRRIVAIDGGWKLLNYEKYRAVRGDEERKEYQREWDRANRSKAAVGANPTNPTNPTISDPIRPNPTEGEGEGEGEEYKTREAKKPHASRASLFEITEIPNPWRAFAQQKRPDIDPEAVFQSFRNYWVSQGKGPVRMTWIEKWKKWVTDEKAPSSVNGAPAWWASNEGIQAKAAELGVAAPKGGSWADLKALVSARIGQ